MKKKYYFIGAAIVLIIIILIIGGSFNLDISYDPDKSDNQQEQGDLVDTISFNTYTNQEAGYTLRHPIAWEVVDDAGNGRDVLVADPSGAAFVRIRALADPSLTSVEAIEASMESYNQTLRSGQDGTTVTSFDSQVEGGIGGFFVEGSFVLNGAPYQFKEQGLLATGGRVLIIRGAAIPQVYEQIVPILEKVIDSFELI